MLLVLLVLFVLLLVLQVLLVLGPPCCGVGSGAGTSGGSYDGSYCDGGTHCGYYLASAPGAVRDCCCGGRGGGGFVLVFVALVAGLVR